MMEVSQGPAPQHGDAEEGPNPGLPGLPSLEILIVQGDHGHQWRVAVRDQVNNTFVYMDKFDIDIAKRRKQFVENVVQRLQVPEGEAAHARDALRAALDARVGEMLLQHSAEAQGDASWMPLAGAGAPCIINYSKSPDNKSPLLIGMDPQMIAAQLYAITDGFPKRIEGRLFAVNDDHQVVELDSSNKLFAWMRARAHVEWEKGSSLTSQEQFYEHLAMTAEAFDAVEVLPHHPPIPGIYYAHPPIPSDGTGLLDQLLGMFHPATEADRELIRALILTLFWGGRARGATGLPRDRPGPRPRERSRRRQVQADRHPRRRAGRRSA